MSLTLLSLNTDMLAEIALWIDDLTSYMASLNTCRTTRALDEKIKAQKKSQLITTFTLVSGVENSDYHVIKITTYRTVLDPKTRKNKEVVNGPYYEKRTSLSGGKRCTRECSGNKVDNKKEGLWTTKSPNLLVEKTFTNGVKQQQKTYRIRPNNEKQLEAVIEYVDGKQVSRKSIRPDGTVLRESVFDNNRVIGSYRMIRGVWTYQPRKKSNLPKDDEELGNESE